MHVLCLTIIIIGDPNVIDLLSSPDNGLCLRCHYMHSQHYPDLKLIDYITSTSSPESRQSSSQPLPSSPTPQRCNFCSESFSSSHSSLLTRPFPSGLASLREVCAVREPQTELECSLTSQWITGMINRSCRS